MTFKITSKSFPLDILTTTVSTSQMYERCCLNLLQNNLTLLKYNWCICSVAECISIAVTKIIIPNVIGKFFINLKFQR